MIDLLRQPWPWYVAGPLIAFTMFLLLFFGKNFGISSTLRTTCAIGGAGKVSDFFRFDWKKQIWNLVLVIGMIIGGFIASAWLQQPEPIPLAEPTVQSLQELGISNPGEDYLPAEIFSWESLFTLRGFILLVFGGFLVDLVPAMQGAALPAMLSAVLSDLQLPSLIAVIGFFLGGLIVTYLLLPIIMQL